MSDSPKQRTVAGYEGTIYLGKAGQSAETQLTTVEDLDYTCEPVYHDMTPRGTSASPPISESTILGVEAKITWGMFAKVNSDGKLDDKLATLIDAGRVGYPVAIRVIDRDGGKGYDGDCSIAMHHGMPLKGLTRYDFTATPYGGIRSPQLNV